MVDENRATQVYTDRINQLMNQEANELAQRGRILMHNKNFYLNVIYF